MKFSTPDYLSLLDSQAFGRKILYIQKTRSTNDEIWEHFTDNDHLIVVTDNQTQGRGRRGNSWISKEYQSLTFSVGLIDDSKSSSLLSLKVAIALCKSINNITDLQSSTKWPNDILIKNKKVAGILIESKVSQGKRILNIGVGVNIDLDSSNIDKALRDTVTSINTESKKKYKREDLLAEFIKELDSVLYKEDNYTIKLWSELCMHINQELKFHDFNNRVIKGIFTGVDGKGRAMIDTNGKINFYFNGIIQL